MTRWVLAMITAFACGTSAAAQSVPNPSESPIWHVAARGRGMPAVSDGRVFVLSHDHDVFALSLDDGHELWRRSTRERGASTEGFKVVAAGATVIGGDWDLYAYDAETGTPRWEFHPTAGYAPGYFLGDVDGTRLFTGSGSGHLFAIDTTTGRQIWRTVVEPIRGDDALVSVFDPVTNGRLVVAAYSVFTPVDGGGLIAVDAATGAERWRFRFPTPAEAPRPVYRAGGPVITADLAIAAAGDGRVWAVDLGSGAVRFSLPPLEGPFDGIITRAPQEMRGLAVVADRLLVGSLTGYLTAYDLTTQRPVWQLKQGHLGSLAWSNYTHADGIAYVTFISGFIHAVDAATGTVRWRTDDFLQGLFAPVVVAGDRVIAVGASGVWAFPVAPPPAPPAPF